MSFLINNKKNLRSSILKFTKNFFDKAVVYENGDGFSVLIAATDESIDIIKNNEHYYMCYSCLNKQSILTKLYATIMLKKWGIYDYGWNRATLFHRKNIEVLNADELQLFKSLLKIYKECT